MTTPTEIQAPVMTSLEYAQWRGGRVLAEMAEHIRATGLAPIRVDATGFYWTCPGCGGTASGDFATDGIPVSGWEQPRWTREGDPPNLTLQPSLGCPRWRDGRCIGHWWLRDGRLVLA